MYRCARSSQQGVVAQQGGHWELLHKMAGVAFLPEGEGLLLGQNDRLPPQHTGIPLVELHAAFEK